MTLQRDPLAALSGSRIAGMKCGVEKESLRVLPASQGGGLALTPHPVALGSALTHERITTDYSESQLELITGVNSSAEACERELIEIHQFVHRAIGDELLWAGSMPCGLPADENIPIGRYGSSNIGRMKSVYRMGLGHRYGRRMQTISGIHYNWSLPGLTNDEAFALIRNFRRQSFLLLLLFGASPAVCPSFVEGREHGLQTLAPHTLYLPHATSLRMGRLGYQSDAQSRLAVSYNSLERYAASLHEGLTQPHPPYEQVGIRNPGGEYNQLATTLLQIENEFYGTIRPKRVIHSGERPLHALRERGVEYIEVRCMDLDPFVPVGITAPTMRFIDLFLLHCLLTESPPDSPEEIAALARNQQLTASRGREPGLQLERSGGHIELMRWAAEIVEELEPIVAAVARALPASAAAYQEALRAARAALDDPHSLPAARVLHTLRGEHEGSYTRFVRTQSQAAKRELLELPFAKPMAERFAAEARASIDAQCRIEAADTMPFEEFRQQYFRPERLLVAR